MGFLVLWKLQISDCRFQIENRISYFWLMKLRIFNLKSAI